MNSQEQELVEATVENRYVSGLYVVGLYLVNRVYGGPEEGGWWYEVGSLVTSAPIYDNSETMPTYHRSEESACDCARALNEKWGAQLNRGRRDIGSIGSPGHYIFQVHETILPFNYPESKPRYE